MATKQQAKQWIVEGQRITHRYFLPYEFVAKHSEGMLIDEGGFIFHEDTFWSIRKTTQWDKDWQLFL